MPGGLARSARTDTFRGLTTPCHQRGNGRRRHRQTRGYSVVDPAISLHTDDPDTKGDPTMLPTSLRNLAVLLVVATIVAVGLTHAAPPPVRMTPALPPRSPM